MNFKNILDTVKKAQSAIDSAKDILPQVQSIIGKKSAETGPAQQPESVGQVQMAEIVISDEMTDEQEEQFLANQRDDLRNASDVNEAIAAIARQADATIRFCEMQKTKRENIRQDANVKIAQINAMSDMVKQYLDKTFDERSAVFNNYFDVLDKALENEDTALVAQTLNAINSLAASSPFKNLADIGKIQAQFSQGAEWDI